jgi:serpin B
MKKIIVLANLLLIITLLAACAAPTASSGQQSVVQSDKPRDTQPNVSESDLQQLAADNRAFAFNLYQQLRGQSGNLFYSPHSISVALAMTYAGARNDTQTQMRQALHFTLPDANLNQAFNALQQALAEREKNQSNTKETNFRLNVVNALWGQKGYTFLPAYLDILSQNYGAGMRLLDFKADPETARQVINQWVADQTADKIKDLIPPSTLDQATTLVLTNAIYFNAQWQYQFNPDNTASAPFNLRNGSQVNVPTMHISEQFGYYEGDGFKMLELPYAGNQVSMFLIVPDQGKFGQIEQTLSPEQWDAAIQGLHSVQVNLALPKFNFTYDLSLSDPLARIGMPIAFQPNRADFSGMDGTQSLYLSDVLHKAFINLDEFGTEAAAATAVVVGTTAMPAEPVNLNVDRPFLFAIQDKPTGEILFMGRVVDPSQ